MPKYNQIYVLRDLLPLAMHWYYYVIDYKIDMLRIF